MREYYKFDSVYIAKVSHWFVHYTFVILGMVVNGFVNVVITTIERRFGLKSSETGLIAGGYDIASFLLLVPVSYLGGRAKASKPRYARMYVVATPLSYALILIPISRFCMMILININLNISLSDIVGVNLHSVFLS